MPDSNCRIGDNSGVNTMLAIPQTRPKIPPAERYRVNFLAELGESVAPAFTHIGVRRRYRNNQFVQHRGDSADHALICVSGRLRSVIQTADGTEQLIR